MRKLKCLIAGLICTSFFLVTPLQAAKKKPNLNAKIKVINVVANTKRTTPKSYVKRKQMVNSMKATLKRGKATLKKARSDLSAVAKSEQRNRKDRLKAKAKKDKAFLAMQAKNNFKNQKAYIKALNAYLPAKERHQSALKVLNSQQARYRKLRDFQRQAMNAKRQAKRLPARQGAPAAINRSPQFGARVVQPNRISPADQLPPVPTNSPRERLNYSGTLSPFSKALIENKAHYQSLTSSKVGDYVNMPNAPAFNY